MEISNIHNNTNIKIKDIPTPDVKFSDHKSSQIALSQTKPTPRINLENIKELLASYGLSSNSGNIELLLKLLENDLPNNRETLIKLNQALKLFNLSQKTDTDKTQTSNLDKAVFTLKNQLPITEKSVQNLNTFLSESKSITHNIKALETAINTSETKTAKAILEFFTSELIEQHEPMSEKNSNQETSIQENSNKNTTDTKSEEFINMDKSLNEYVQEEFQKEFNDKEFIPEKLIKNYPEEKPVLNLKLLEKFTLKPYENNLELIEEKLNNLMEKTETALKLIEKSDENLPKIKETLENLKNNLEFTNNLKTCTFIPIPLNLTTNQTEAELYVFKDGKVKKKSKASSALIALNTVNLARIEAYIQKDQNNLNIQFRSESEIANQIIRQNAEALSDIMKAVNLRITALSILPLDKPFDITQKEPSHSMTPIFNLNEASFDTRT